MSPQHTLVRRWFTTAAVFLTLALQSYALIGAAHQMLLGNPSNATTTTTNHDHYLIQRDQYAMDYNDTKREPNWVSWNLTAEDVGGSGRSPNFFQDTTLPAGFYQVLTTDYSGSGYDRGHMCPSADRTVSRADNDFTFYMSNMVPQTPDNNQGVWASFETYCRTLAAAGNEVLITSGTSGFAGSTIASGVAIPGYTWKIVVVVPLGAGTAVDRIIAAGPAAIRVITIKIPNIAGVRSTPWENFVTSAAQIEADTGYTFFTALPGPIASAFRTVVDGSSAVGSPTITSQPASQTTVVGGTATFSVTASGNAPLSYQWVHDDIEIPGATSDILPLNNVQAADVGSYYVVVTNDVGSTTSNAASLVVTGLPPVVTVPPASQTVNAGTNVTFAATVTGSPTLAYQWRKNSAPISGATASTLTLVNVQAGDTASYDVYVSNSAGFTTSAPATLTVNASLPVITGQPASRTAVTAENASFTVTASGTAPLAYQWRKEGSPLADGGAISGAATATLLISGVTAANGGNYDVVVTNALGFATSAVATLTVNPPPPSTVAWTFADSGGVATASPTSGLTTDITGGTLSQRNNFGTTALLTTVSPSTGTGASGTVNAGAATVNGALNLATSTYFEFTLAPGAGKRLLATGLSLRSRSTGTGPQALAVYSSVDGFTNALATMTNGSGTNWALYTPAFTTVTGLTDTPITFRIYGYNGVGATGSTAVWRIDDLKLTVSAVFPPPVAPVVTATSPANGATGVAVTDPITVTFNEAVAFSGSWFTINSAANGPLTATVQGGPTTFTLATPSGLAYNDTVTIGIIGSQVVDQASGTIHGTANTTFSFTTQSYVPPTPPAVTGQPAAQTVFAGGSASFSITAAGTAPLNYQWRKNGTPVSGNSSAATATLSLTGVTPADAGNYSCVVTNVAGSDVSQAAALTVNLVPASITTQPSAQLVAVGGTATFTVGAAGTAPLAYQWRHNGVPLANDARVSGATGATLTITGVTTDDNGTYTVSVSNPAGSATSNPVQLAVSAAAPGAIYWDFGTASPTSGVPAGVTGGTVTQGNNNGTTALLTTTSPSVNASTGVAAYTGASGTNNAGAAARIGALVKTGTATTGSAYFEFTFTPVPGQQFAATALTFGARSTGTGPQAYAVFSSVDSFANPVATGTLSANSAWQLINTPFAGVTGAAGAPVTFRIYGYNGLGSPGAGTANWRIDDVRLTAAILAAPPTITSSPVAQTATVGDLVLFGVAADGSAPFSYQWRRNGVAILDNPTAMTSALTLAGVVTAQAGDYDCVVTNAAGSATSAAATLTVNPALAAVTLGTLDFVYNGTPAVTTATTTPAGLPVTITYDGSPVAPTNAGSYAVVATVADADYIGSASGTLTIAKAVAGVSLGNLSQTYDGAPRFASASTNPGGLAVVLSYDGGAAAPVNAGSYVVVGTVNDANYIGTASATLTVAKAVANVTLGDLSQTYNGAPKPVSAATNPAGLAVDLTYDGVAAAPVNAGSYAVVGTVNDANYIGTASATLTVAKAVASVTLGGLSQTYDGAAKPASATTSPAGLAVEFTYDGNAAAPVNAGSYAVVATINELNYMGTAGGTLTIGKAAAAVTLGGLSQTYDGAAKPALAVTAPAGLAVDFTYDGSTAAPTNAGSYAVVGTVNDANYAGTASGTLVVAKAAATVTLSGLNQIYDGAAKAASAVTTPAGLTVDFTYDGSAAAPVNAGSYAVVGTVNNANYAGAAGGTLVVAKAVATVSLGNLAQVYDGAAKPVTVTTAPASLNVVTTYNGSPSAPSAVGSYTVVSNVQETNYVGTASGTLMITQASATVTLSRLVQAYDGTPKPVGATTTPADLTVSVTYNGSATAPTYPGAYAVVATLNEASYQGTASGMLVITTTAIVRHAPVLNGGIDGSLQVLLPESTTLNGSALLGGDLLVPGTPLVQLNGHPVYAGTVDAPGASSPTNYQVTLNGNAALRHVVRRVNAVTLPVVAAPPAPAGTRNVSLNNSSQSPGDFATLRNLTLNGNGISVAVPAGTYGTLTLNGNNVITLGTAGATTPAVYNLQGLTLNGNSQIRIAGPVIVNLAAGVSLNGSMGDADHPEWLLLNFASGGLTLNGNVSCAAYVLAPAGQVTVNGNSTLSGGVICDRLTLNGNGLLQVEDPE